MNTAAPETILHCRRCGVGVPENKVDLPGRCGDWRCPLNSEETNAKLLEVHQRSRGEAA
jgi:hypothetical protein